MNIEEMQKEENFEHEVLDRLKCLDPTDFDYNAVDGSYVDAVLKARDILLTAYEKEKEKNKEYTMKINNLISQIESAIDFMKTDKLKIKVDMYQQKEEDLKLEIVHLKKLLKEE